MNTSSPKKKLRSFENRMQRAGLFLARFTSIAAHVGWLRAVRFYIWDARSQRSISIYVPILKSAVHFRGYSDYYSLLLLFVDNFHLAADQDCEIRTVIDLGANIGSETLRFEALHPAAKIVAVEADPDNHAILVRNTAGHPRVKTVHAAAWGEKARFKVTKSESCNMGSVVSVSPQGELAGVTVEELIDDLGGKEVDVIKIDIEGAEDSVFGPSLERWIGRVRAIVWELNDHEAPHALSRLVLAMKRVGVLFNFHICGEKLIGIRADAPIRLERICGLIHYV